MTDERANRAAGASVLAVSGAITRADVAALCERLRALTVDSDPAAGAVICDVGRLASADMVAVNALARLQLTARRLGCRIQLRGASAELQALLALVGLSDVVPLEPVYSGPARRQAEQREQALGIEEEGDAADPTVLDV